MIEEVRDASTTDQPTQMIVGTMAGTTGSTGLTSNEQNQPPAKFKPVILDLQARAAVMTMPQGWHCYRCASWCPEPFPKEKCRFCEESPSWHCRNCCPVYKNKVALGSESSQQKTGNIDEAGSGQQPQDDPKYARDIDEQAQILPVDSRVRLLINDLLRPDKRKIVEGFITNFDPESKLFTMNTGDQDYDEFFTAPARTPAQPVDIMEREIGQRAQG